MLFCFWNEFSFADARRLILMNSYKRADIIQAALELIAERGFHDAPMSMIAKKAGVAAGTIYRYFESKDVLITELHCELADNLSAHLEQNYPTDQPLREKFLYLNRELLRYFIEHPLIFRYKEQYSNSPYSIKLRNERFVSKSDNSAILIDIFERGIERQVLKNLPKAALFNLAFGPLFGLMRDHSLGFITLDDSLIDKVSEACWDAIKREY